MTKLKIKFLDELKSLKVMKSTMINEVFSPKIVGEQVDGYSVLVNVPAIQYYKLENVIISAKSSNFIGADHVIIERIPILDMRHCNYATGGVKSHDEYLAEICEIESDIQEIEGGIFLGGNGSWNYYHWITELLPKIQLVIDNDLLCKVKRIILSDAVNKTESFSKTLAFALEKYDVNLEFIDPTVLYRVDKLHVISSPNNILFNPKVKISDSKYNFYRKESLDYIRELVFKMLSEYNQDSISSYLDDLADDSGKIKIFLARKPGAMRKYNQEEVIDLVVRYGFKVLYIEDYAIEIQAAIFANADYIVGASGAAWTNLIFCKGKTFAISWLPTHLKSFSAYSSIAAYYDVEMRFIECRALDDSYLHSAYKVPLESLNSLISRECGS